MADRSPEMDWEHIQSQVRHFNDFGCSIPMKPDGYLVPKWVKALAFLFVIVSFVASLCVFVVIENNGAMNYLGVIALIVLNILSTSVSVFLLLFAVERDAEHLSPW